MTQGRNSKPATMLACALVALALAALTAPAFAGAQAATDEYSLQVPGSGSHSDPGGGGQGGGSSTGGGGGGGGAPLALIGLAGLAAACAGVAVWRLRGRDGDGGPQLPSGASSAASESQ